MVLSKVEGRAEATRQGGYEKQGAQAGRAGWVF
jgi:hypothetical protein